MSLSTDIVPTSLRDCCIRRLTARWFIDKKNYNETYRPNCKPERLGLELTKQVDMYWVPFPDYMKVLHLFNAENITELSFKNVAGIEPQLLAPFKNVEFLRICQRNMPSLHGMTTTMLEDIQSILINFPLLKKLDLYDIDPTEEVFHWIGRQLKNLTDIEFSPFYSPSITREQLVWFSECFPKVKVNNRSH